MFNRGVPPRPPSIEEGPAPEEPMPYPGPDTVESSARVKLDQNALGIYAHPPPVGREGDVVLPRAITDEPPAPYIRKLDKSARTRRNTSMLDDLELSREEFSGADYLDSIRRSDNPKTVYTPTPAYKGKRR